jgi:HAD superfamily hydrolase (TIGR01490 family)
MRSRLAFLDIDHTLTRRSTGARFAVNAVRRRIFPLSRLLSLPFYYLQYRFGSLAPGILARELPAFAGIERGLLEEIAAETAERDILPDLFEEGKELVASLKKSDWGIVLATSSLDFIVRPVAEALGADELIASELEFEGDITTGRLLGDPVFGPVKRRRAGECARRAGLVLSDCAFYSDSYHDLPLLLEVGRPVAVNPDRRLEREAKNRSWDLIRFRS